MGRDIGHEQRSISFVIPARAVLSLLASLLLLVAISSRYRQLQGGQIERVQHEVQHRRTSRALATSGVPHRGRVVSSDNNCNRMCGDVAIPYPFGLSAECARNSYFQLECRNTSGVTGHKAQILPGTYPFLMNVTGSYQDNGTVSQQEHFLDSFQVLDIDQTNGTMIIDTTNIKASSCLADFASAGNASILLSPLGPYRFSGSNLFITVGCDSVGQYSITGPVNSSSYDSFTSQCGPNSCQNQFSFEYCGAYDCCVVSGQVSLNFYLLGSGVAFEYFSVCGFSTMLYPPSYSTFSGGLFGNATYGAQLQWALQVNGTQYPNCSTLEDSSDYACSSSPAICQYVDLGIANAQSSDYHTNPQLSGYFCQCPQAGYRGDGYIMSEGCEDIDECRENSSNCAGNAICSNLPGSYNCSCPSGSQGDGFVDGTGCTDSTKTSDRKIVIITTPIAGATVIIILTVIFAIIWKLWKQLLALRAIQQALAIQMVKPPFYEYDELKLATKNFHVENKLGKGGYGIVYKGVLADNTTLAVKKLFNSKNPQVLNDFLNEVVLITGIKHKNLVQLKGCCIKDKQRILVYEYAAKGNLAEALWGPKSHGILTWEQRFNICLGVARGLAYLHEELQPSIIHRDIKPENILLDVDLRPKIADFGLAKHFDGSSQALQTKIAGTLGYFSPEYAMQGQLSEKADVYSFGVVVLEIISGRRCIDSSLSHEKKYLITWVEDMSEMGTLAHVLQPELRDKCVEAQVLKPINIALLCLQQDPKRRPSMSQVVTMLCANLDENYLLGHHGNDPSYSRSIFIASDHESKYPTIQTMSEQESTEFPLLQLNSRSTSGSTLGKPSHSLNIHSPVGYYSGDAPVTLSTLNFHRGH